MKKRLFLTGPDRSGKSDLIRQALGDRIAQAGGFLTLRERDEQDNILGFDLVPADGSGQAARFLEFVKGKPVSHLEVFSQMGTRLLNQAGSRPFAVLDELGGVELLDDAFLRALVKFLRSDTPCIGVMKGPGPAGKTVGVMGLNLRYELARRVVYDYLSKDPDTLVLHTTGSGDSQAMEQIARWAAEYIPAVAEEQNT